MKNNKKEFKAAIIGLGYVGLPLYFNCIRSKINTFGFDINKRKITDIKKNISPISDITNLELKSIKKKNIFSMDEAKKLKDRNIIILCLPTPLKRLKYPNLDYINKAVNSIKKHIKERSVIILESTVYPGVTRKIFETKYFSKKEILFGFSSERISPGQTDKKNYKISFRQIPKITSGNNAEALKKISQFYKLIFKKVHKVNKIENAEMSKLLENSYRAINISFINELKILCNETGLDIHDVVDAASTKPFGFTSFSPGPGVGGHCIPIDPLYLNYYSEKNKIKCRFVNLAHKINVKIQNYIFKKINLILSKSKIQKKILLIGIAYKPDVNDFRESPALNLYKKLLKINNIDFYDPFINQIKINNKYFYSLKNLSNIKKYSHVIIATDHSKLPYSYILKNSNQIIDTRGAFKKTKTNKVIFL